MSLAKRWNLLNTTFLTGTLALALVLVPWRLATAGLRWSEVLVCLAMVFAIGTAISGRSGSCSCAWAPRLSRTRP